MIIPGVIASEKRNVPNAPTIGTATDAGSGRAYNNGAATVTFTAPTYTGGLPITSYTVTSSPGGFTASGASSPITVTGLQSSTSYTYTVTATNALGTSSASSASNSVTATTVPQAPTIGTATDGGTGTTVTVAYTAGATGGSTVTAYTATSSPGGFTGTGTSPITVSGLTAGTAYTFTVTATNANGTSAASSASNSVTPAVPSNFTSIATITAAGGESSLTFSSIPQTYTDLQIRAVMVDTGTASVTYQPYIQFNGDGGNNYNRHQLIGTGSSASAQAVASQFAGYFWGSASSSAANFVGGALIDISDYTSTSKYKTFKSLGGSDANTNDANHVIGLCSGVWINTAAITSITFLPGGTNWAAGTQFALYGIKAAA